jgi:hypothetical protein
MEKVRESEVLSIERRGGEGRRKGKGAERRG